MRTETVSQATLAALVSEGSVHGVRVLESGNGEYGIVVKTQMGERTLATQRGDVRRWVKIDTLKKFLKEKIGVTRFEVIGQ